MLLLLYRIGSFLALVLPINIAYRIAEISGSLYYFLARRDRKIVNNNIKIVLKQTGNRGQFRYISRMVFVNFARYLAEFFRSDRINSKYIKKYVTIIGKENLDKALSLGRGVLLVSAHLGNWELGAMVVSMLGYRASLVAWTHQNKQVNDFFLKQRHNKGLKIIALGSGIRGVFSALKNNEIVALLGDIDYANPQSGLTIKLFGRDVIMPKGPAAFSVKTGAPIIPVFMVREEANKFKLIFNPPIIYQAAATEHDDLTNLTQSLGKALESYIALYPQQWFMLTPRWPAERKN